MPKRTRDYHEFLLEQLTDPVFAAGYLNEARQDSQKMFLKALRNVAEAMETKPMASNDNLLRYRIYYELEDGTTDSLLVEGETLEEIRDKANSEIMARKAIDAWSEEVKHGK